MSIPKWASLFPFSQYINMKNIALYIIILLSTGHVNAQISRKYVSAIYSVKSLEGPDDSPFKELIIKQNPLFFDELNTQIYTLNANAEKSYFQINGNPSLSFKRYLNLWVGDGSNEGIWQDSKGGYVAFPKSIFSKEPFLMQIPRADSWKITNESKQIGEFTCIKATTQTKTVNQEGKEFIKNAIAWFCPDLDYPFGPLKYGGLPGLILELQTETALFGLKSISFSNTPNIKQRPNYEVVTEAEQSKRIREQRAARKLSK
ncbi:GLPGLI family protein [Olivibacter sitiensis]|uniref:GLPGLI family protein n=1 Tax=Olivibacter sitiensis TaxID=376470 RepID=UPI0004845871|nr:GLPGLI family protein [Olivibacter sitiensis]